MMRADLALAEPFGQLVRHTLDQAARVDENQARAVPSNLLDELVIDRRPNILANDRAKLVIGNFDAQLHLALMPDVDDGAIGGTVRRDIARADKETRYLFDRLLCCAQADPLHWTSRQCIEPFQRKREMRSSLVLRDGVNLIDDQRVGAFQEIAAARRRQQ